MIVRTQTMSVALSYVTFAPKMSCIVKKQWYWRVWILSLITSLAHYKLWPSPWDVSWISYNRLHIIHVPILSKSHFCFLFCLFVCLFLVFCSFCFFFAFIIHLCVLFLCYLIISIYLEWSEQVNNTCISYQQSSNL